MRTSPLSPFLLVLLASALAMAPACSDDAKPATTDTPSSTDATTDTDAGAQPTLTGPWQHPEPIVVGLPTAPTFPLFVDHTADVLEPLGLRLGNGRAMVVDFDGDGRDDIVAMPSDADIESPNTPRFIRNTTAPGSSVWSFEDWTAKSGMAGELMVTLVFGDIDNDGDIDAFSGTSFRSAPGVPGIWLNDGTGHFTRTETNGLAAHVNGQGLYKEMSAATMADFDGDGFLDLYITLFNDGDVDGNYYMPGEDELYRGDGTGMFTPAVLPSQHNPVTSEVDTRLAGVARRGYGLCPADYDDDGDMDLFVNNYGAGRPALDSPPLFWDWNLLWRNEGNMSFIDLSEVSMVHATTRGIGGVQEETPVVIGETTYPGPIGGNGFGCHWGDFDNDGDLDLIVGTIAHPDYLQTDRTMLHVNPGGDPGSVRVFGEESAERGLEYYEDELHPFFIDFDNDGRLDLSVSRLRGGSKLEVYLQTEVQRFAKKTWEESGIDIERPGPTLWLDVDSDGDLDFFMPQAATGRLFENKAAHNNFLVIEAVATAPRDATGTRITMRTRVGAHVREIVGGSGHYNTQASRKLYFGLGSDTGAKDVAIRWPNGDVQQLGNVKANYKLRVNQGGSIEVIEAPAPAN